MRSASTAIPTCSNKVYNGYFGSFSCRNVLEVTFSRLCDDEHYKALAICEMVAASAGEELRRRGNRTNT